MQFETVTRLDPRAIADLCRTASFIRGLNVRINTGEKVSERRIVGRGQYYDLT